MLRGAFVPVRHHAQEQSKHAGQQRDPDEPAKGSVRWEMDPLGELHVNLEGKDDVRAFTWGLVIRGFDIDEGQLLDLGKAVSDAGAEVNVGAHGVTP